jgi:Cu-processing system permease protein
MNTVVKVMRYELSDVLRSRWLVIYTLFFLAVTDSLLRFTAGGANAEVGLLNVVLVIIPLVSIVFGTMHRYNAREFTELLLAQPIRRSVLFKGLYLGLALPLAAGFIAGVSLPFLLHGGGDPAYRAAMITLVATGTALTFIFTAISFSIALFAEDRLRGLGIALGVWLLVGLLYDGLVLVAVALFADYPIERPILALTLANPVDLARVLLLLKLDVAALMGYTGAVFQRVFSGPLGPSLAAGMLGLWIAVPLAVGARQFRRKDF